MSLLLLPPFVEDSSHSFPAAVWEIVLYGLNQYESSPRAVVLCKLPQHAVLLQHGSCLPGSTGLARNLLQHGFSIASQPPSCRHLLWCAVLQGLQVDLCSPLGFHGLQGFRLPHPVFTKGCRGISALAPGAPPVFSTALIICRAVSHSPLLCSNFFPINTLSQSYCF